MGKRASRLGVYSSTRWGMRDSTERDDQKTGGDEQPPWQTRQAACTKGVTGKMALTCPVPELPKYGVTNSALPR